MLREGRSNSSYIYIHMHTHIYMSMQMYVYIVLFKNKLADLIFTFHFGGNSGDTCPFSMSLSSHLRLFSVVYCRPVLAGAPVRPEDPRSRPWGGQGPPLPRLPSGAPLRAAPSPWKPRAARLAGAGRGHRRGRRP